MVHVADNSLYGFGYREINQQLAKDNGELRQQLSLAFQENAQQRAELHRKDVELVELRCQVQELTKIREKYEAIKEIIENEQRKPVESVGRPLQTKSRTLTRNDDDEEEDDEDDDDNDDDDGDEDDENDQNENEDESAHAPPLPTSTTQQTDQSIYLQPIEEEDSLNPPDVTSVPPITHDDRSLATPSIWNCLDTLAPEPSPVKNSSPINLRAMFESTPVQPPSTVCLAAQARQSRGSDRGFSEQQRQQQQQQRPQHHSQQHPPTRYNLRKRTKRI